MIDVKICVKSFACNCIRWINKKVRIFIIEILF